MPAADNKEQAALKQLRERIPDLLAKFNWYKQSDDWLLRWLRARELDLNKTEEMLRKHLQWRITDNIDTILDWKVPEIIDTEFTMQAPGFDNDGCVVATVPFGKWDVRKLINQGLRKEFIRYINQIFEQAMRFLENRSTREKILTQFVIILDFEGFSMWQLMSKETIETIAEVIKIFEANHPETLKSAFVVNAPKYFEILFAVIKPLLTARTLSKVQVHGSNRDNWGKEVLSNIKPDQLPSEYGGTISSPHNFRARYGFDVFPKYETLPESDLVTVTIDAGKKHKVRFDLEQGSCLSWNFKSTDYDIGFQLLYQEDDVKKEGTVFNISRADAHKLVQKGAICAGNPGTYTLVFDNSYSKFKGKTVQYATKVERNAAATTLRIIRVD